MQNSSNNESLIKYSFASPPHLHNNTDTNNKNTYRFGIRRGVAHMRHVDHHQHMASLVLALIAYVGQACSY